MNASEVKAAIGAALEWVSGAAELALFTVDGKNVGRVQNVVVIPPNINNPDGEVRLIVVAKTEGGK